MKGKEIKRMLRAAVLGTRFEKTFKIETAWKTLLNAFPERLHASNRVTLDESRSRWTTVNNLEQWFNDAKKDLIATGLVINQEVRDTVTGDLLSELDFRSEEVMRRFINMDETHHDLSITGDKGESRLLTYRNLSLQRGPKQTAKPGRHATGVYAKNAAGETIPPMFIFDSAAKVDSNFRVKVSWLDGLPTVSGRYGCPEMQQDISSYYSVCSRGSMDDSLFNEYIENVILPLYPNISKTTTFDANGRLLCGPVFWKFGSGPGQMVVAAESLSKHAEFFEKGLFILIGLPNATSVHQEMDALFGAFKCATYARGEDILTERLSERGRLNLAPAAAAAARTNAEEDNEDNDNSSGGRGRLQSIGWSVPAVAMGFDDLATIVNGKVDDELDNKPFDRMFTAEKIVESWKKIGLVPFTRKCVSNPAKVRHELGQSFQNKVLEELQESYNNVVWRQPIVD